METREPSPASPLAPVGDEALMQRVGSGDLQAFEVLYERYRRQLLRFLAHLYWDPSAAEDAVQEVFLRLWRAAPRYAPRGRFSTYLYQIAKNFWLTERERRARAPALAPFGADSGDGVPGGASSPDPADPRAGPGENASAGETAVAVRRAVDALPEGQRLVVVLADFQGLPYREVAEILGIPVGTVKSRHFMADKALRDSLKTLRPEGGRE